MRIGKAYYFSASHLLPDHDGKCKNLHGHNYKVEVEIKGGVVHEEGTPDHYMIVDFALLDNWVKPSITNLDHTHLNDMNIGRPTAEAVADHIAEEILFRMHHEESPDRVVPRNRIGNGDPELSRVRVWETDKCYGEWTND